jgi:hypothetical protein
VHLVVKPDIDMLVGIFAILSCGAQYVLLDGSAVPDDTLRHILLHSRGGLALCTPSTEYRLSTLDEGPFTSMLIGDNDELEGEIGNCQFQHDFTDLAFNDSGCYMVYQGCDISVSKINGPLGAVSVTHSSITKMVC